MHHHEQKDFFKHLRRSINISYFIASIIPLSLLVYFSVRYIYPLFQREGAELPLEIGIILFFAVFISLLGLILSIKATNTSIRSIQNLHTRLSSLFDITKQMRETQYIDVLLENIVRSAIRLNSAEAGSLLLLDETGNLRFRVATGKHSVSVKDRIVRPGEGFAGWVVDTGQSIVVNDVKKDGRYNPDFDHATGFSTRSIMCVPLLHKKKIIGVIEVLNRRNGLFTAEDERLLAGLADQAAISIIQSRSAEDQQGDIIQISTLLVEAQDSFTQIKKGHSRNVAKYAHLIGKQMKLSDADLKNLYHACLFHDIGFMKVDINIPPTLSDNEKLKNHPQIGYEMIKPLSMWSDAAELILYHHERFDGTGYPSGKKADAIPLGSRIIFVADTFDILTNETSYRTPLGFHDALAEIEDHSGTQFDPEVVAAFKSAVRESDMIEG